MLQELAPLAFVPTAAGKLAKPCELYDPREEELMALMDPSVYFPASNFQSPEVGIFLPITAG